MATWPSTLPAYALISGYALNPVDQTIRTDMEVGTARVRRRTAARYDMLKLSWVFTDAQLATFRTWFDDATTGAAGGAGWFNMSVAVGETGLTSHTCRFVGAPQIVPIEGMNWQVSASVEVK